MSRLLIGTSAWSDLGPFYPSGVKPAGQLGYYSAVFPVVEVNTTYYRIPTETMVNGWLERTPSDFVFDVKPLRELTGTPDTPGGEAPEPDAGLAESFYSSLLPLVEAGRFGALTFQFPPSWRNTEQHQEYLRLLPDLFPRVAISVEFRRRDWLDEDHAAETFDLLTEAGLSFTMADEPQLGTGTIPPVYAVTNPKLAIIRFHGRNAETWYSFGNSSQGRFDWHYTDDELREWIPNIEQARDEAEVVHIFFNTNAADQGPRNAFRLMNLLEIPVPTPPSGASDSIGPIQARLI